MLMSSAMPHGIANLTVLFVVRVLAILVCSILIAIRLLGVTTLGYDRLDMGNCSLFLVSELATWIVLAEATQVQQALLFVPGNVMQSYFGISVLLKGAVRVYVGSAVIVELPLGMGVVRVGGVVSRLVYSVVVETGVVTST